MNLARSIKVASAIKGCAVVEVARGVGVSPSKVSQWRSTGLISLRNIEKLAAYFEMTVSEFIKLGEEN